MVKNLLFDFDGTIVDTSEGIIKSMHYAFEKLKLNKLENEEIKKTIGPPLVEMFKILLNTENTEIIDKGIYYFRERYAEKGLYELKLYDNVEETLSYLQNLNLDLFIVTSKPYDFTIEIMKNLRIDKYFKCVSGINLSGRSLSKSKRVENMINNYVMDKKQTIMIGDRSEDIIAANKNGIGSIGVVYGFGKEEDLINQNCYNICSKFSDIKGLI